MVVPGLERERSWIFKSTASFSNCRSVSFSHSSETRTNPQYTHRHTPVLTRHLTGLFLSPAQPSHILLLLPPRSWLWVLSFSPSSNPPITHKTHTFAHTDILIASLIDTAKEAHSHVHAHNTIFPIPPSCCFFSLLLWGSWHLTVTVYCAYRYELCGYTLTHTHKRNRTDNYMHCKSCTFCK